MFNLNGWHRLWIFLSVIYGLALAAYINVSEPWSKKSHQAIDYYAETWAFDTIKLVQKHEPALQNNFVADIRYSTYKDLTHHQVVQRLQGKYNDKIDFSEVNDKYQSEVRNIISRRFEFRKEAYLQGFLFWLFPVVAIYLLAWAVSWVIKGFYRKKT